MNFEKLYIDYIDYISFKLKISSINSIKSRFNFYILPYFKNYKIEDINPVIYFNWQKEINNKNLTYAYKKALHYTMVSFYSYLGLFHNFNDNVPRKVGNFKNDDIPKELNIWSYDEFYRFINIFEDIDFVYKIFFIFLFHTGCRLGECLALTFDDLHDNSIFICKTISKEHYNGHKVILTPKSKSSIRHIKIDNFLLNSLYDLKKYYINTYKDFDNSFYIFGGYKSLSITSIERRKKKYCELAQLKNIRLHDFRHSNATFLIQNNIPIIEVSRRLGHSDINMTIKTYTHLINDYEKKVLDTFNSLHTL